MKRFLLLLSAALPAAADDLEADRAEAAAVFGRLWKIHGNGPWTREARSEPETWEQLKEDGASLACLIQKLYPSMNNPGCHEYRFVGENSEADRDKCVEIMQKRLLKWGGKTARVLRHGGATVYMVLGPDDEDLMDLAYSSLAARGLVEFRLEASQDALDAWKKSGKAPEGTEDLAIEGGDKRFLAAGPSVLEPGAIESAKKGEAFGRSEVRLRLTEEGGRALAKVSKENLNRRIAIISGGVVLSAPLIRSEIGRDVVMTGLFTPEDAVRVADAINLGTLPCRLEEVSSSSPFLETPGAPLWDVLPAEQFLDRVISYHVIHLLLEDVLRARDVGTYKGVVEALKARQEKK